MRPLFPLLAVMLDARFPDLDRGIQPGQQHGNRGGPGEPTLAMLQAWLRKPVFRVPCRPLCPDTDWAEIGGCIRVVHGVLQLVLAEP